MARVFSDEELLDFVREAAEGSHMISRNTYVQYRERQKALGRDLPALETIIKRFGLGWYGVEAVAGLGDLHSNPLAPLYELKRFLDERPAEAELVGPTAFHALVERVATEGSDALFAAGTCGIVVGVWRDTIEPLHYRFSNAEMALTSIATCVDLKPLITDMHHVAEQLPWQGIAAVVTRDDRVVLEGRTTSEVFGGEWGDVKGEIQKRCESHSEGGSLGRYVLWCCAVCPFWHGGPLWNRLVDRFCAGVDLKALPHGIDPLQLHFQLTHDPLSLSVDEFAWLLQNGLSSLDDLR